MHSFIRVFCAGIGLFLLLACSVPVSNPPLANSPAANSETLAPIATLSPTRTPSSSPSHTPTTLPTARPTLSATPAPTTQPPAGFTSSLLRTGVTPQGYIHGPCEYLRLRWSDEGSPPGTLVVPIMFHSIVKSGRDVTANWDISEEQFRVFVQRAEDLGFETITTAELDAFLQHNAPIPPRSMILIVDDRRPGVVREYFLPVLEENGWKVTLGWIVADTRPSLWAEMERMNASGLLDIQSHGYWHRYIGQDTPEEQVQEEILDPIPVLEEHFGQRPLAFIWPGGNFSPLAVQTALRAGYQLGFSSYSRGPLMFNWIPLGEPEKAINYPPIVLPRFWSTAGSLALDQAIHFAEEAIQYARDNAQAEQDWYSANCPAE